MKVVVMILVVEMARMLRRVKNDAGLPETPLIAPALLCLVPRARSLMQTLEAVLVHLL